MKFINYTNDGRVVVQHAALILSKLDETDTLELHTMDNAIILLKKDMTLVETRDVLQGMVRLARSMTLDALCNSDAEDKTPLVDESVDDEYEDMPTVKIWSVTSRSQIRRKMRICVEPMPFPDAAALPMSLL